MHSNSPVLIVQPGGVVQALFTEAIRLHELGPLKVARASSIEFNTESQKWEVRLDSFSQAVFADSSRQACLQWEQQHFNNLLLNNSIPFTAQS